MLASTIFHFLQKHSQPPAHESMLQVAEKPVIPSRTKAICKIPATNTSPPPISSLPSELLGEIFQLYLDEAEPSIDHRPNPWVSALTTLASGTVNPIVLGHICSQWRSISLSMPTLWSSLAIYRPNFSHIPLVRLWLKRSGPCPLRLSLSHAVDGDAIQHVATREILALFIGCAHRWRSIRFVFQDRSPSSYSELLKLPQGAMGVLESAHIDLPSWSHADADKLWESIYSSPSLRRVHWGTRYKFSESTVPTHSVPWAQLTHITMQCIDDLTVHEFLDILESCQELLELDVSVPWPEAGRISGTPVVVPKLRVCRINAWKYNSAVVLNRVSFPALTSLHLVHALSRKNTGQPASCSYIIDFLLRSACDLRTFSISDPSTAIAEKDLGALLRSPSAQSLENVSLDLKRITDETANFLTRPSGKDKPAFLPNLSVLSLFPCKTSDGALLAMVKSRLPVLRAIAVRPVSGEPIPSDLLRLETLRGDCRSVYGSLQVIRQY